MMEGKKMDIQFVVNRKRWKNDDEIVLRVAHVVVGVGANSIV